MADEEELEQPQALSHQTASHRPERRIEVREHDTTEERTKEIIEFAETVLDTLATQRPDQGKNDASMGDISPAGAASSGGALMAMSNGPSHKDVATMLKRKLDEALGGTWHVIVGSSFGGNVTNDNATLVNFVVDGLFFLVLRSGPPDRPVEMVNAGEEEEK